MSRLDRIALIFCPDLGGHRQIYCFVIGRCLAEAGYRLVLAGVPTPGQKSISDYALLAEMVERWQARLVDLAPAATRSERTGWTRAVLELEREFEPAWTFLPTGEEAREPLFGLGGTRSAPRRNRAAIFVHATHVFRPAPDRDASALSRLVARGYHHPRYRAQENRYYKSEVWDSLGLTVAFSPNEVFVEQLGSNRMRYLPDIYRAWGSLTAARNENTAHSRRQLEEFLQCHLGREVLLYFGGWTARRGFDLLLELCARTPDTVLVTCGRPIGVEETWQYDVPSRIALLQREGRIHIDGNGFVLEDSYIDALYASTERVLLPYMGYLGMSGSLVQAVAHGRPVVVPDRGYMAGVIRKWGVGLTFHADDFESLRSTFGRMRQDPERWEARCEAFAERYAFPHVRRHLLEGLSAAE
jgi:glycosyltransferase involved in cell wall biosynthesis